MRTAAMGSPVVGFNDSSRSPWVWMQFAVEGAGVLGLDARSRGSGNAAHGMDGHRISPGRVLLDKWTQDIACLQCRTMYGLLPPLLLALFGAWCGTFAWGPSWPASAAAALALLGSCSGSRPPGATPCGWAPTGRLLPWALWIALAASGWASPVPRAGWLGVVLLPAFLLLPAVVERCWRPAEDRRRVCGRWLSPWPGSPSGR